MGLDDDMLELPHNRAHHLNNVTCPYCAAVLDDSTGNDKEHVVGRRLVPKGTLQGHWNLLLRSCTPCNGEKAALENDISAITMQPDAAGRYASDDPRLVAEAARKAKNSFSRMTGRPVAKSQETAEIKGTFGSMTITFSTIAPPQVDEGRLFRLAQMQLQGFFHLLTFQKDQSQGYWWPGPFAPVVAVRKGDWGNPRLRWIEQVTAEWETIFWGVTAEGFYKIWIRRERRGKPLWAWAIEWNMNFRLAGFCGDTDLLDELWPRIPPLEMKIIAGKGENIVRGRLEVPLSEDDDRLLTPEREAQWAPHSRADR